MVILTLPNAATSSRKQSLRDRSYPTRDHIIEPLTTSGDCTDQGAPRRSKLLRTDVRFACH